jgi:hypothetical protein
MSKFSQGDLIFGAKKYDDYSICYACLELSINAYKSVIFVLWRTDATPGSLASSTNSLQVPMQGVP